MTSPPPPVATVHLDGVTYRLPFLTLIRLHTPAERARLEASIRAQGVRVRVVTYDSPTWGRRCVIDGATRLRIVADLHADGRRITCPVTHLGTLTDPVAEALAISLNVDRRHLTPDEQQQARAERIERVVRARSEGQSLRAIGDAEGISHQQVKRDLADAAAADAPPAPTVTPVTPAAVPARAVRAVLKTARAALAELSSALCELAESAAAGPYRRLMTEHRGGSALDALDALLTDLVRETE